MGQREKTETSPGLSADHALSTAPPADQASSADSSNAGRTNLEQERDELLRQIDRIDYRKAAAPQIHRRLYRKVEAIQRAIDAR